MSFRVKYNTTKESLAKECIVRRVVPGDEEQIKELSRGVIYYEKPGREADYLPAVIDKWLRDPNIWPFAVEYEGKLVAFKARTYIDQGKTLWGEGLRVHRDYRSLGFKKILDEGVEKLSPSAPFAIRNRWTTDGPSAEKLSPDTKLLQTQKFLILNTVNALKYFESSEWKKYVEEGIKLESQNSNSFVQHVCNAMKENLVKEQFVGDWKAYDVSLENFKELERGKYVSYPKHDFWIETNGKKGFSVSSYLPRAGGPTYSCTIYASSFASFLTQLYFHLQRAKKLAYFSFFCTYGSKWEKEIEPFFKSLPSDALHYFTITYLYEKSLLPPAKL